MKTLIADKFSEAHIQRLNRFGCEVTYNPAVKAEDLPELIAPYKILVVRGKQVTADTLKASSQLALVLRAGAGVNTIDVQAASARGVFVSNCPGKNSIAVAELVFALLLAIDRRIPENAAALRAHKWNKKEFSKAEGVFGKTLGVVGTGQIGREVITRARAFGLRVVAWSRSLTPEKAKQLGVERCDTVDEVLRQADIVTLHLALKPDTRKFISADRLALLKPNAILINTARGEVVDQAALRAALEAGRLRAGLDVFDPEPAEAAAEFNDPILDLPNLCGTHHIGASTGQAQEAIAEEALRIIETYVKTGVVLNCVNLTTRTPANWQLVVRHYDRVGVLAFVMDQIRRAGINIEEVQNVIFEGATAACCRIQLDAEPGPDLLAALKAGNPDILGLELMRIVK
ncbi:MAG TPA: phosphoglycerate dehydrogenase [Candidatus Paceibacterota bacterium]|nr:phosphoglycerate dehydrogenase [Verrucomicrobiota bacterium]HSA12792.1 phosphoglycerate dehydrogenase [Candidatus Paceibacterota bacterium]